VGAFNKAERAIYLTVLHGLFAVEVVGPPSVGGRIPTTPPRSIAPLLFHAGLLCQPDRSPRKMGLTERLGFLNRPRVM
jgi:hypothetical protein